MATKNTKSHEKGRANESSVRKVSVCLGMISLCRSIFDLECGDRRRFGIFLSASGTAVGRKPWGRHRKNTKAATIAALQIQIGLSTRSIPTFKGENYT